MADLIVWENQHWLDPKFVGGEESLLTDIWVGNRLFRGVDLGGCITYHVRVPPELFESVPTRIVVKPSKKGHLPDFGLAPWGGWGLVSSTFVDIVEGLEPDVHQFLPIAETVDRKGHHVDKRYFLMNILQCFNAVDIERSSVEIHETERIIVASGEKSKIRTMRVVEPDIVVLKHALIAGHHLWHGTTEDVFLVFFSDALHDAVIKAGLSPLYYRRAEEV